MDHAIGKSYPYRYYLETMVTYGSDAATPHLTNAFWYLDDGNMIACSPLDTYIDNTSRGIVASWYRAKQSIKVEMHGRIHCHIFNLPQLLLPGLQLQIHSQTQIENSICYLPKKTQVQNLNLSITHFTSDELSPPLQYNWHTQTP
jgi:hypothetical protein